MANHTTGAQRYNARMDKIMEQARKNGTIKTPERESTDNAISEIILKAMRNAEGEPNSDKQGIAEAAAKEITNGLLDGDINKNFLM